MSHNIRCGSFMLLIGLLTFAGSAHAERFYLKGGTTECWPLTSSPFIMRDLPACGADTIHCVAPIKCSRYFWGRKISSTGIVACRAQPQIDYGWCGYGKCSPEEKKTKSTIVSTKEKRCPSPQQCALDPYPALGTESELKYWTKEYYISDAYTKSKPH